MGIPVARRAALLSALCQRQRGICVAGMHGKTTTTALLAFALEQLRASPSYAVGALVPQLVPHARFSTAPHPSAQPWFVVEADESDGSLCMFRPVHAIVLNVDEEHLDHYHNLENICRIFETFTQQTEQRVVYCADDPRLCQFLAHRPQAVSYGFSPQAQYRIEAGPHNGSWRFGLIHQGRLLDEFEVRLVGEQNLSNAAAVVALLHQVGYEPDQIAQAIAPFRGAARRQQQLFRDERFRVFDDYGHHPREIVATIQALRTLGGKRLLVAFQPHRFTRTQHLIDQFATCFKGVDRLWITEIYAASEEAIPGVDGRALAAAVQRQSQAVEFIPSLDELFGVVRAALQPGDTLLFLGAGDITRVAREMAVKLAEERDRPAGMGGVQGGATVSHAHADVYADVLALLSPETLWRRNEPLSAHTTLRVGGPADMYLEPASEEELGLVLNHCQVHRLPILLLGRGSNLLVGDRGFRGVVLCLAHPSFARVAVSGQRLRCGAGVRLKTVVLEAKRHSLGGLEFLEGIPGCVGGALRMNAGAMGGSIFDVVETVRLMDKTGRVEERSAEELDVEYRECRTLRIQVALAAVFKGEPTDKETIAQTLAAFSEKRWSSQPAAPSAGCIFKNPTTMPAGRLIEELGFKGRRVGGALVSDAHANFIVNTGSATAHDILILIRMIQERARTERGIELHTELVIVGE
jgi:UDP-N-acetylmuramate--L-alanine ligase/UDP-N-acetylenolpyruvoylglucosamine reductase